MLTTQAVRREIVTATKKLRTKVITASMNSSLDEVASTYALIQVS